MPAENVPNEGRKEVIITHIILSIYLLVLSIFDIRRQKIPHSWLAAGGIYACACLIYSCKIADSCVEQMVQAGRNILPGLLLLFTAYLTGIVGSGDGWLLIIVGVLLGRNAPEAAISVLTAALLLAALAAMLLLFLKKLRKGDKLPFVPFLTAAVVIYVWS